MVTLSSLTAALAAAAALSSTPGALAKPGFTKNIASTMYRNFDECPERCYISGASPGRWSAYPSLDVLKKCHETMFYSFSLSDPVDEPGIQHKIYACTSYGPDFGVIPPNENASLSSAAAQTVAAEFEMGWFREGFGLAKAGIRSIIRQMHSYVHNGHGNTVESPLMLYGKSGQATVGLYIGQGLLSQGVADSGVKTFNDNLRTLNTTSPSLAVQLCGPGYDASHVFGIMATSNGTFAPIQNAFRTWSSASCLQFESSITFTGGVQLTTPLQQNQSAVTRRAIGHPHAHGHSHSHLHGSSKLHVRADECRTVQVESGDSCAALATKCGISPVDFTKYNDEEDFCATLIPKQRVCCSEGDLPDFSPKPNEDGSCFAYQVKDNDNCGSLAASYSLTRDKIEEFNQNTWGWNGCELLFVDTVMCLSEGDAPFPAPIANAICGPQKPGSEPPADGSDISEMNPCPLNACCNIWGQCGITKDFCENTNTGAPGTAEPGTYGCISNCGMDIKQGVGNGDIKIGYYQGYCLSRDCLYQAPLQIDPSAYTHIHFGFGLLTPDYDVEVGDQLSTFLFERYRLVDGPKRILSIGGWAFSTEPETYMILRNGVKPANRKVMATKIANFVKENNLDGIDIDWEYPGAPDLPAFDPGTAEDGPNYLAFLVILKNLLPDRSVAIAAPASYWYLKQFPIEEISRVVDYIVYMTYDLHGQWDAHNSNSQDGCDTGNCLRSQVNLTETRQSLAMITKAGVPGEKVVAGVTSYGRSFKMAEAGCDGPGCKFTGERLSSNARKGRCTGTAGYIADAEIEEILADESRVNRHFVDPGSHSDILVYDDTEWVGFMSPATKAERTGLYANWGLGGTSDWATDLQSFHAVPGPNKDWSSYRASVLANKDPMVDRTRNGGWTDLDCSHESVADLIQTLPEDRWETLRAKAAWEDIVRIYQETDREQRLEFMESFTSTTGIGESTKCRSMLQGSCGVIDCPHGIMEGNNTGPGAYLIYNSLSKIHKAHVEFHDGVDRVIGQSALKADLMEDTFAPIPPKDPKWELLLIDLLTLGALGAAGPVFNSVIRTTAFFQMGNRLDNAKDTTMTLIGQSTTIAKDVMPGTVSDWTDRSQNAFTAYMAQVLDGWARMSEEALDKLFSGNESSLDILWKTMDNGKLIAGWGGPNTESYDKEGTISALTDNIQKAFYTYSIPALWRESQNYAFIMHADHPCDEEQLTDYFKPGAMRVSSACVFDQQWYLVHPGGDYLNCYTTRCDPDYECETECDEGKFSAPPGLDVLPSADFNVSVHELIKGSVQTWEANDRKNGAQPGFADPEDRDTMEGLIDLDFTTPGYIRLPVCSAERARQSWESSHPGSSPNYPCDIPPGSDECHDSTFENETSDASPLVEDCLQIISNIEGDASTDFTHQVVGENQRQILQYGSCAFGIEATATNGNADFTVGGQDVIDIINDAVSRFGAGGKIGAKGQMKCSGNVKDQDVEWGIYHD